MKYLLIGLLMLSAFYAKTQVGIGKENPEAELDIYGPLAIDTIDFTNFEDGTLGNWTNVYGNLFSVQNIEFFDGTQALRSGTVVDSDKSGINLSLNLPAGRNYFMEVYVKFNLTPAGTFTVQSNSYSSADNGGWNKIVIPLIAGNYSLSMILDVPSGSSGDAGIVYIDNILIGTTKYSFKMDDGSQGLGKVLTSDEFGNATWDEVSVTELVDDDGDTKVEVLNSNIIKAYANAYPILVLDREEAVVNALRSTLTRNASATGFYSVAWGDGSLASANKSTAWGTGEAAGVSSTAWGSGKGNGILSTAWGSGAQGNEYGATAWGQNTRANGYQSTAFGNNNTASLDFGTVWGGFNAALGEYTTMWGYNNYSLADSTTTWGADNQNNALLGTVWGHANTNTGWNATIWGLMNTNSGLRATVWGEGNKNQGDLATIFGNNIVSSSYLANVFGRYNVNREESHESWKESESLFQIGNGSEDEGNDAILVLKNGNVGINMGFEDPLPKEKLEVKGNIKSSKNVIAENIIVFQNLGIGTNSPQEELVIQNHIDTSHMQLISGNNLSLLDMEGSLGSRIRMMENDSSKAEIRWETNKLRLFSQAEASFPIIRFPTIEMTPDRKVGINKTIFGISEALDVGGRIKLGYNDEIASEGVMRYNTINNYFEGYNGAVWKKFGELPIDEDGDSYISFKEDAKEDSLIFIVNGNESMSFNGHTLTLGKDGNTFIGYQTAGLDASNNIGNTSMGWQSTPFLLNGVSNTNLGFWTGHLSQTGDYNTNLGAYSAYSNANGSRNTMLGYYTGYNNTGNGNVFIGHMAGRNETGDNQLYIDNTDTIEPLVHGDFDLDRVAINGDLYLPDLASFGQRDLAISSGGRVFAKSDPNFWTFYSGDFHDWISNLNNVECALGLNQHLDNGDQFTSINVTVIPFNPVTHQDMNIRLLLRNLITGEYTTLLQVNDNNIPGVATTYMDSLNSPITVDKTAFEFILVSSNTASQILKVVVN